MRETFGPLEVWPWPTYEEIPLAVDATPADPMRGQSRGGYGFRYVFGAFSSTLSSTAQDSGAANWMPLTSIRSHSLQERVRGALTVGMY